MAGSALYCGMDIGTSRIKLAVFDESFSQLASYSVRAPLIKRGWSLTHDPSALKESVEKLLIKAGNLKCRAVGISVYRASIASWRPRGLEATRIVLWADVSTRIRSMKLLGLRQRLLAKIPVVSSLVSPLAPLPILIYMERLNPGMRTWSIDALVSEWISGRYAGEPVNAGLIGVLEPLKGIRVSLHRLAGFKGEEPRILSHDTLLARKGSTAIGPLIADQQASLLASGCIGMQCIKLDLGSGCFADAPLNSTKGIFSAGAVPIIALKTSERHLTCLESMVPGLGLFLEILAESAGMSLQELSSFDLSRCAKNHTPLVAPYHPMSPSKPWIPASILGAAGAIRLEDLICGGLAGSAMAVAYSLHSLSKATGLDSVRAFGGASRIRRLVELAARIAGVSIEAYHDIDGSALGAAALSAYAVGDISLKDVLAINPSGEPVVVKGGKPSHDLLALWEEILRGNFFVLPELSRVFWETIK